MALWLAQNVNSIPDQLLMSFCVCLISMYVIVGICGVFQFFRDRYQKKKVD